MLRRTFDYSMAVLVAAIMLFFALQGCTAPAPIPSDIDKFGKLDLALQQTETEVIGLATTVDDLITTGVIKKGSATHNEVKELLGDISNTLDAAWAAFNAKDLTNLELNRNTVRTLLLELRNILDAKVKEGN